MQYRCRGGRRGFAFGDWRREFERMVLIEEKSYKNTKVTTYDEKRRLEAPQPPPSNANADAWSAGPRAGQREVARPGGLAGSGLC